MTKSTGSGAGSTGPVEIMSEALSVADVLDRAADLIEPEGAWTQHVFGRDADGRFLDRGELDKAACLCCRGAMLAAGDTGMQAHVFFAHHALNLDNGYIALSIANWNDDELRTQAEVVAKLRQAAELAREQSA